MKVENKITASFVIAFVALCLVGTLVYFDARTVLSRDAWVVHTYQVLQKIDQSFDNLQEMELGGRGYLLTGNASYLEPYTTGQNRLRADLDALQLLTVDNPVQQLNIGLYRSAVDKTVEAMRAQIEQFKARGAGAVPADFAVADRQNMDRIRALTARLTNEEQRLLGYRNDASARGARHTLTTFALLLLLALLMLLGFYLLIRHDLTERRRTAAALAASDRRFRGVMESAPDAMLISNAQGTISLFNSEATRLFGYGELELLGRPLGSLLLERAAAASETPAGEDETSRLTRERALSDLQARGAQLDGVRQNGERFPVDLSRSPLESNDEHLEITIIRDRTEQQRAEDALRTFSLDLARSNAELERFAYVASHDLQEPLRMVSSYTQLLAKRYKGKLDANADEFIAYAVDGATRMQKLISDLLALSRVGTQARPSEPVDTGAILTRVLADLQPAIEATGATVIRPPTLPVVLADATQMGQLFQNLLGNSLKFHGPAPPRLEVRADPAEDGAFWRFAIQDNGIGIDAKYFERIFVIFQRLHGKETYEGTGIGLAICKKIVERHGGRLWLESAPGEGTTFLFTLPAIPA